MAEKKNLRLNCVSVGTEAVFHGIIGLFSVCCIIPFLFVFNPILLLENYTIPSLCFTTAASILGVIFMAIAGVGYLHSPLNLLSRSIFFAASLLLIVPETITSIIGAVMIAVGIVVQKAAETKRAAV